MEKADEVKRNYRLPDEEMLAKGNSFLITFLKNKSKFIIKFNDLNDPFAKNMQDHLDFCGQNPRDNSLRSIQVVASTDVEETMEKGRYIFQYVYGYLVLDKSNDATVRMNFGQPEYKKSRRSHIKLPVLLEQAYLVANDPIIKAKLIAKGATESDIEELHSTGKEIFDIVQGQKSVKGGRKTSKKGRIIGLNLVWADMCLLSNCSKTVFMNDYAMRHLFLLYPKDKIVDIINIEKNNDSIEEI